MAAYKAILNMNKVNARGVYTKWYLSGLYCRTHISA